MKMEAISESVDNRRQSPVARCFRPGNELTFRQKTTFRRVAVGKKFVNVVAGGESSVYYDTEPYGSVFQNSFRRFVRSALRCHSAWRSGRARAQGRLDYGPR